MESRYRRLESELQSAVSEKNFLRQHYERMMQENSGLMMVCVLLFSCCWLSVPSFLLFVQDKERMEKLLEKLQSLQSTFEVAGDQTHKRAQEELLSLQRDWYDEMICLSFASPCFLACCSC